jgi:hypothetical protein
MEIFMMRNAEASAFIVLQFCEDRREMYREAGGTLTHRVEKRVRGRLEADVLKLFLFGKK